jgi:glutamyl-Q tRNA(Asp) synthetase
MSVVTRFAPSPTGDLHLGHAFSAHFASQIAVQSDGRFIVRIEDIDATRCRPEFIERNLDDLEWLGLASCAPVIFQSRRMERYRLALQRLHSLEILYPCFCSRKRIRDEIDAAGGAPQDTAAQGSLIYPGTCRTRSAAERAELIGAGKPYALRLHCKRIDDLVGPVWWTDRRRGRQRASLDRSGDVVVARKEMATSYHLAVVVDDAEQGITEVTRGEDLFDATHVHRVLYALLGLPVPVWNHHEICRDSHGRRLAKRHGDVTIRALRGAGLSAARVLAMARESAGRADTVSGGWKTSA